MVDILVKIRGPRSLAESVREALEGAAHTFQDLTLGNDDGLGDRLTTYRILTFSTPLQTQNNR